MIYVALFFAGALLCNGLPHLVAGLQGARFPTPFAKPPGRGESAPVVNFIWGAVNLAAGVALLVRFPLSLGLNFETLTLAVGALLLGLSLSLHFGGVRGSK
jgi:hypothetical protein